MKAVLLGSDKKNDWDEFVLSHPYTISWHMYDFYKVIQNNYNTKYYPLAVYDGNKICGILPLYHIRTKRTKDLLISCPYVVAGGIVARDLQSAKALFDEALNLSRIHNSCRIILKQYKIKNDMDLLTDDNFYNRELDLTQSEEELWNGLNTQNQKSILEAEKFNLQLDYPSDDIDGFYEIVFSHHHAKGIPCPSKKWIESKFRFGDYSYKIAMMKLNGLPVAGTMAKSFKKTVSLPYTAIKNQDHTSEIFAYKMYWDLIRRLKQEGLEICHSGRIPNNDTVDCYRLGWGGTKYPYYYQYYPNTNTKTEFSVKRGRKRKLFESFWRKLPKAIVKAVGPSIVKQFP